MTKFAVTYWVRHPDQPDAFYDPSCTNPQGWWPCGGVHEYGTIIEAETWEAAEAMLEGIPAKVVGMDVEVFSCDDDLDGEGEEWKKRS